MKIHLVDGTYELFRRPLTKADTAACVSTPAQMIGPSSRR